MKIVMKTYPMIPNGIWVPSAVISDIDKARFKNINDLSYDIWCNTLDSKIHMEVDIPNMLEKVKTFNKGSKHVG